MKSFIKKITLFSVPIIIILFSGLFLPPTPRASTSLLFANRQKDSLLLFTKEPRIIFIGGSNLSFGLNSYMIKDSLNLNPINTAIHVNLGIRYMLENTLQYLKKGDIVILALEYENYYRPYDYVSDELLRTISDVCPKNKNLLSFKQDLKLLPYIPKFTITKYNPTEYFGYEESDVYSVNSFDKFGDVDAHWDLEDVGYEPSTITGMINIHVIKKIKEFENTANKKGVMVYVTFPSLDEQSFNNSKEKVFEVEKYLKDYNFVILGNAERYIMPKEMMFNTTYHLNKKGLEYRTQLFIEDFRKARMPDILYIKGTQNAKY